MQTIIQKLSFYNEIELVHIFISDFHVFEKNCFATKNLLQRNISYLCAG